jgi:hypothetical protein
MYLFIFSGFIQSMDASQPEKPFKLKEVQCVADGPKEVELECMAKYIKDNFVKAEDLQPKILCSSVCSSSLMIIIGCETTHPEKENKNFYWIAEKRND